MIRRFVLSCSVLLLCVGAASAQVKLERKLREGTSSKSEAVIRFEQKFSIAGMDTESTAENRRTVSTTVGQRDGLGRVKVDTKIDKLEVRNSSMGQEYVFDSDNPDTVGTSPQEMIRPLHKALCRQTIGMIFDKSNELVEVELDQQILNEVPEEVRALVKSEVDPAAIKKQVRQKYDQLPTTPLSKGDVWERTESMGLGAGQVLRATSKYTYEGTIERDGKKLEKISLVTTGVEFLLEDSPLPLKVKKSALKPTESEGTILFDREVGETVEEVESLRVTGEIDLEINGMTFPSKLDLKIATSLIQKK